MAPDISLQNSVLTVRHCPGCGADWQGEKDCDRCGLTCGEVTALLTRACDDYSALRESVLNGDFHAGFSLLERRREWGVCEVESHPAVARLFTLCEMVAGRGSVPEDAAVAYEAARDAAAAGQWEQSLRHAEHALRAAPGCLPAQKLYLLCLSGAGRGADAEKRRQELVGTVRDDPELSRWRFTSRDASASGAARRVKAMPRAVRRPQVVPKRGAASLKLLPYLAPLSLAAGVLGVIGFSFSVAALLRPSPVVLSPVPTPASAPAPSSTPSPPVASSPAPAALPLAPDLQAEYDQMRHRNDEQQARRWFNAALSAMKSRRYSEAERLSWAAYCVGKDTYIAEDALLLHAQAADNRGDPQSASRYLFLAQQRPGSVYAPVALLLAVQAAMRQGKRLEAETCYQRLQQRYPASPEAGRARRILAVGRE